VVSTLYLVRHGQATAHSDDYDVLSPLGREQSQCLGRYLARQGAPLDAFYSGPLRRQLDTAAALREAAGAEGTDIPEVEVLDGFSEIDARRLLHEAVKRVTPSHPSLGEELAAGGPQDEDGKKAMRHMWGVFRKMLERWAAGESIDGIEPFEQLSDRVHASLRQIMRGHGRGRTIAVVTSGGPIAVVLKSALALRPDKTVGLLLAVLNSSVTEITYTPSELSLTAFNRIAHLDEKRMVTRI
jgi:broad specificity phosphatase PhoE